MWELICIVTWIALMPIYYLPLSFANEESGAGARIGVALFVQALGAVVGLAWSGWAVIALAAAGLLALVGAATGSIPTRGPHVYDPVRSRTKPREPALDGFDDEPNTVDPLRFAYADENGEVTERELTNWIETDAHVEGFCTLRRRMRTFRKDRVQEWIGGSEHLLASPN